MAANTPYIKHSKNAIPAPALWEPAESGKMNVTHSIYKGELIDYLKK